MKKIGKQIVCALLGLSLSGAVFAAGGNSNKKGRHHKPAVTQLKKFKISKQKLKKIESTAQTDGEKAAAEVNELSGDDFEKAVHTVLTFYYKNDNSSRLEQFEKKIDRKAEKILSSFKEAAKERSDKKKS